MATPWTVLLATVATTALAGGWSAGRSLRRRRAMAAIARQWSMHFSAADRFGLGGHLAGRLGVPGAAEIVTRDVMYGLFDHRHCYVCTVEFTLGAVARRRRVRRVARITEPRRRGDPGAVEVAVAPEGPLMEGYRGLIPIASPGASAYDASAPGA